MFRLNPQLDRSALKAEFARERRVQIADFLVLEEAAALLAELKARPDWRQVVNSGDEVYDLDRETRKQLSKAKLEALETAVLSGARKGFQHRYEAIRIPDEEAERAASSDMLAKFALWMSGGEARDLLREVTGMGAIDFADAQATCYSPGDFLTAHDDEQPAKHRLGAYVFSLTPQWSVDWGGLLLFHRDDGNVGLGITPRFNTLNIFAVPQMHSVSMVNRIALYRRYSITGWLRSRPGLDCAR